MDADKEIFNQLLIEFKNQDCTKQEAQNHLHWIKHYLQFNRFKNAHTFNHDSVKEFLFYLSNTKGLMPSQQKEAYNAINFMFTKILNRSIWNDEKPASIKSTKINLDPVKLKSQPPKAERPWMNYLQEPYRLVSRIISFYGLQTDEVLNLRLSDIDLQKNCIHVRDAFGNASQIFIAEGLMQAITVQLKKSIHQFKVDTQSGNVCFRQPNRLAKQSMTQTEKWYYLFPGTIHFNLQTQQKVRESLDSESVNLSISEAKAQYFKSRALLPNEQFKSVSNN